MPSCVCQTCKNEFFVDEDDAKYLARLSRTYAGKTFALPAPKLCPDCRKQRRLAFRNERNLYASRSALSGKNIVSAFSPDKPIKSYEYEEWWTDAFEPFAYGRKFDFTRPFFPQFKELFIDVPHMALAGSENENCPYCHLLANCRNCYLIFESSNNEDCYYCYWIQKCVGCCDTSFSHECQYCYEVDNCYSCYSLAYSKDCTGCSESYFLESCIGCKNCYGCVNLHQKEYWVFNKPVGKVEFERVVREAELSNYTSLELERVKFRAFAARQPKKYAHILNSENCTGDYIISSRDCKHCYHAHDAEDCKYAEHVWRDSKSNRDVSTVGREAELVYESLNTCISAFNVQFAIQVFSSRDLMYCVDCMNSHDCFGCVGLKRGSYSIFNMQYSREDYEALAAKIVEHMISTGEYGEFFPPESSPFGYAETSAAEAFPLSRESAVALGYPWSDYKAPPPSVSRFIEAGKLPEDILKADDEITSSAVICAETARPFRIIRQELELYRSRGIPLPRLHPDVRHDRRMAGRNPQQLYRTSCESCNFETQSTYAPERNQHVLCADCYAKQLL